MKKAIVAVLVAILGILCCFAAGAEMAVPQNLRWVEGSTATATWDAVEGATYYDVLVSVYDGETLLGTASTGTSGTEVDVQGQINTAIAGGQYTFVNVTFQVSAEDRTNPDTPLKSAFSGESPILSYQKYDLETPTDVTISEDGILSWDAVNGADNYEYIYEWSRNGEPISGAASNGWISTFTTNGARASADISADILRAYTNLCSCGYAQKGEAVQISFVLNARATSGDFYSANSARSNYLTYSNNEITVLGIPQNVSISQDGILSWDTVEGASGFEFKYEWSREGENINGSGSNGWISTFTTDATRSYADISSDIERAYINLCSLGLAQKGEAIEISFVMNSRADGDYYTADSAGSNYLTYSNSNITVLTIPQNVSISEEGILSWDAVEGADYYEYMYDWSQDGTSIGNGSNGFIFEFQVSEGRASCDVTKVIQRAYSILCSSGAIERNDTAEISFVLNSRKANVDYYSGNSTASNAFSCDGTAAVQSIQFSPAVPMLYKGNTIYLGVTISPASAFYQTVEWTSSDETVATIGENGLIQGMNPGTTTITATIGEVSQTATLTVYTIGTNITNAADQQEVTDTAGGIIDEIGNNANPDLSGTDISANNAESIHNQIIAGVARGDEFHTDLWQETLNEGACAQYLPEGTQFACGYDAGFEMYHQDPQGGHHTIGNITEFDKEVEISFDMPQLPEEQEGYHRSYSLVRVHENRTEEIPVQINSNGTWSAKSSQFSDFILLYKDRQLTMTMDGPDENNRVPVNYPLGVFTDATDAKMLKLHIIPEGGTEEVIDFHTDPYWNEDRMDKTFGYGANHEHVYFWLDTETAGSYEIYFEAYYWPGEAGESTPTDLGEAERVCSNHVEVEVYSNGPAGEPSVDLEENTSIVWGTPLSFGVTAGTNAMADAMTVGIWARGNEGQGNSCLVFGWVKDGQVQPMPTWCLDNGEYTVRVSNYGEGYEESHTDRHITITGKPETVPEASWYVEKTTADLDEPVTVSTYIPGATAYSNFSISAYKDETFIKSIPGDITRGACVGSLCFEQPGEYTLKASLLDMATFRSVEYLCEQTISVNGGTQAPEPVVTWADSISAEPSMNIRIASAGAEYPGLVYDVQCTKGYDNPITLLSDANSGEHMISLGNATDYASFMLSVKAHGRRYIPATVSKRITVIRSQDNDFSIAIEGVTLQNGAAALKVRNPYNIIATAPEEANGRIEYAQANGNWDLYGNYLYGYYEQEPYPLVARYKGNDGQYHYSNTITVSFSCDHEIGMQTSEWVEGTVQYEPKQGDSDFHWKIGKKRMYTACSVCGKQIPGTAETVTDAREAETHYFYNTGVCTICGYTCDHIHTYESYQLTEPTGEYEGIPDNDSEHYAVGTGYKVTGCSTCHTQIATSESIEGIKVGEAHTYDADGVCTKCGHECAHRHSMYANQTTGYTYVQKNSDVHLQIPQAIGECWLCHYYGPITTETDGMYTNENPDNYPTEVHVDEDEDGKCDKCGGVISCEWSWNLEGSTLFISGNGAIQDYTSAEANPWRLLKLTDRIDHVIVGGGITRIGANAFAGLEGKVRFEMDQTTAPTVDKDAFAGTNAICRYYTEWTSAPEDTTADWIYLPIDNRDNSIQVLTYNAEDGWFATVMGEQVALTPAQASELVLNNRRIELQAIPADKESRSVMNTNGGTIVFLSGCTGEYELTTHANIELRAPEVELTVTNPGFGSIWVSAGKLTVNGDVQYLSLEDAESTETSVTVSGNIGTLDFFGPTTDRWYRGSLTVDGRVEFGTQYGNAVIAVPNISDQVVIDSFANCTFTRISQPSSPLIDEGILQISGSTGTPTVDMFTYGYEYNGENDTWTFWLRAIDPRIGGAGAYIYDIEKEYNIDFDIDDIVWGPGTELILANVAQDAEMSVDGAGGLGLGNLGIVNASVTVNCPLTYLDIRENGEKGANNVTINSNIRNCILNLQNDGNSISLGIGGSIINGMWNRSLGRTRYFGPVRGSKQIYRGDRLSILNWKDGQRIRSIIPGDNEVTDALKPEEAGNSASIELDECYDVTLSPEEQQALSELPEFNESEDFNLIKSAFDVSVKRYTTDTNGNQTEAGTISELEETVPIAVQNPTGVNASIIRLHNNSDGSITATKLPTSGFDVLTFRSDLFSKYLIVTDGDEGILKDFAEPEVTIQAQYNIWEPVQIIVPWATGVKRLNVDIYDENDRIPYEWGAFSMEKDDGQAESYQILINTEQDGEDRKMQQGEYVAEITIEGTGYKRATFRYSFRVVLPEKTMYLPANLTKIEENAFEGIDAEAVIIPDSCTEIGAGAFRDCTKLKYVSYKQGTSGLDGAFGGCGTIRFDAR